MFVAEAYWGLKHYFLKTERDVTEKKNCGLEGLGGHKAAITDRRDHSEPKYREFLAQPHFLLNCLTQRTFTYLVDDLIDRQTDRLVSHSRGRCRQSTGVLLGFNQHFLQGPA